MIVQAAIQYQGNQTYTGHRHADVIRTMICAGLEPPIGPSNSVQGFIDDKGNFLDRIEAGKHALECGQITELRWPPQLYSEDLY